MDTKQQAYEDIMNGAFDDELEAFVNKHYSAYKMLCMYAPENIHQEIVLEFVDECLDSSEWMAQYERDFAQKEEVE